MNRRNHICFNMLAIIFLLIFVPTLFCIFMWGSSMDYNLAAKLVCTCGNKRILIYVAALIFVAMLFLFLARKVKLTRKVSLFLSVGLGIWFIILFVMNIKICEALNIAQGWDVSCVVGEAYRLHKGEFIGADEYFSLYPNNVPITFLLYKLFQFADGLENFKYVQDFMWIIVICAMISLAGYLTSITVKKLTNSFSLTIVTAVIYFLIMLLTPWKTTPYTDMFSILFPILSLNLYILHKVSERKWQRYTLWFLCFMLGLLGAMIKITVAIVLIAILICEGIKILPEIKKYRKEALWKLGLILIAMVIYVGVKNYIYTDTNYTPNKESAMTVWHFMMMGLNEESTGSYSAEDVAYSGSIATQKERIPAQMKRIRERLEEKGFFGYIRFVERKMVMTFNDGTFGWGREGGYNYPYPVYSTNKQFMNKAQRYFLPQAERSDEFGTHSQIMWFIVVFSLPGICMVSKEEKEKYLPLLLSVFGLIFYQALFEARARYLICFLPILILVAGIGIGQYYRVLITLVHKCLRN